MREIDCRMLNCPEPVLRTKKALEQNGDGGLTVIVDNMTARDNILRFAQNRGFQADWEQQGSDFLITISAFIKQTTAEKPETGIREEGGYCCAGQPDLQKQVILIDSAQLGSGSEELGSLLMRNFIYTLTKRDYLPRALIFMNSGVKLCAAGSSSLEELELLESGGVEILACGTCLDFFGLKDSLRVGTVSNMYDITDRLLSASVVSL
jgi:selenium metabolism protein YedF